MRMWESSRADFLSEIGVETKRSRALVGENGLFGDDDVCVPPVEVLIVSNGAALLFTTSWCSEAVSAPCLPLNNSSPGNVARTVGTSALA
jgi:hypothetical protein